MFCPRCGKEMPEGSKFCTACGEKLAGAVVVPPQQDVTDTPAAPGAGETQVLQDVNDAPTAPGVGEPQILQDETDTPAAPGAGETRILQDVNDAPAAPGAGETQILQDVNDTPAASDTASEQPGQSAAYTAPSASAPWTMQNYAAPAKEKKKVNKKVIIIACAAVAAVVVIIALIFGLKAIFSGSDKNVYAYVSDGKYELITNLDGKKPIEIASAKSDGTNSYMLTFSPDGKYIYYFTKYDSYYGTGTLCRAEYGKLKANSSKNDKYIDIIATNVYGGFAFLDDGSLVYQNGDSTLYYYNGTESTQIAKNVYVYRTVDSNRLIYQCGDYYEGYDLYAVELKNIENRTELASDIYYVYNTADVDNILYTKRSEDDTIDLYVVGLTKEPEKVGENVSILNSVDGKTYFTAANGDTLSLYDYVEDSYASADAGITEPDYDDFRVPNYRYNMISDNEPDEKDYDELYTSCTKSLYWYGASRYFSHSMEEALDLNWKGDDAAIKKATKEFIDKFGDKADEDGYILVTDEVKAALKKINATLGDDDYDYGWLWLCYSKEESGTIVDYDAYYEARDKWYEARSRINMRENLKDEDNAYPVLTLYCFDGGNVTAVSENVLDYKVYNGAVMYNTADSVTEKMKLEDISYTSEVRDLFRLDAAAENNVLMTNDGTIGKMSSGAAATYAETADDYSTSMYFVGNNAYLNDSYGALYMAEIENGVVGNFTIIADDAYILRVVDSTLYYCEGEYESYYTTYCNLYSCIKGNSVLLARDILPQDITIYTDGVILAFTGYGELTMIDSKGETTVIADDVTQYIRVNKSNLLYISGGDLYTYNGKDKKLVHGNVERVWSRESMDVEVYLGSYDFGY